MTVDSNSQTISILYSSFFGVYHAKCGTTDYRFQERPAPTGGGSSLETATTKLVNAKRQFNYFVHFET